MRDPGLLHITALLSRMDDRMENIENKLNTLEANLNAWVGSDDASEYTLDWGSESEEEDQMEVEDEAPPLETKITINGREYEIELINLPMQ
jgi:hypothetical protein